MKAHIVSFLVLTYLAISNQETGVLNQYLDCQQNPETGNCFFSVDEKYHNHEDAVTKCKEKGGFLPILLYPSDIKFAKETLQLKNQEYWIGLKRSHPNGCRGFEDCVNKLEWYNTLDSKSLPFHQQLCSLQDSNWVSNFMVPTHKCSGIDPTKPMIRNVNCDNDWSVGVFCQKSVDGAWSEWSSWSKCQGSCDNRIQIRNRACTNPSPSILFGQKCIGHEQESQTCSHMATTIVPPNSEITEPTLTEFGSDSTDSCWSPWSPCSTSCGSGTRTRNSGNKTEVEKCGDFDCNIKCPKKFERIMSNLENTCYYHEEQPTNAYNAAVQCSMDGGRLASTGELETLKNYLTYTNNQSVWLGYQGPLNSIEAFDGSDLSFKQCLWSHESKDLEGCHYLGGSGRLKSTDCLDLHGYLCVYKGKTCPKGTISFMKSCIEIIENEFSSEGDDPQLNCKVKNDQKERSLVEVSSNDKYFLNYLSEYLRLSIIDAVKILLKSNDGAIEGPLEEGILTSNLKNNDFKLEASNQPSSHSICLYIGKTLKRSVDVNFCNT